MSPVNRVGWFTLVFLAALGFTLAICSRTRAESACSLGSAGSTKGNPVEAAPTGADSCPPAQPSGRLAARVALLVPRFGARGVELVDPAGFGRALDIACAGERECAARLLTMAIHESALSAAISRSEYRDHEGDAYTDRYGVRQHRAWGTFQQHRSRLNADDFGSPDYLVQARHARARQLGALAECRRFRGVDPVVGMWRVLSGRGCLAPYSGEAVRMATLAKVRQSL